MVLGWISTAVMLAVAACIPVGFAFQLSFSRGQK